MVVDTGKYCPGRDWPVVFLSVCGILLVGVFIFVVGRDTGVSYMRDSKCISWCDENTRQLSYEEYLACFERCEEWKCHD